MMSTPAPAWGGGGKKKRRSASSRETKKKRPSETALPDGDLREKKGGKVNFPFFEHKGGKEEGEGGV